MRDSAVYKKVSVRGAFGEIRSAHCLFWDPLISPKVIELVS